jgi:peptide/nickel transport system substrate-binding protein
MKTVAALITRRRFLAALAASTTFACGLPNIVSRPGNSSGDATAPGSARSLIVGVEGEPRALVASIAGGAGTASEHLFELVHQSLVSYDDLGAPIPRIARELPSLERGTWRIHDDGTMETVWLLREGIRWHDGRPLTADDVVFSWRMFNDPAVPVTNRRVARLISAVESRDAHTVVMRWRSRYAFADQLSGFDLTLLPSHLLEGALEFRREQIAGHPYWRSQFVGLGPFRLRRWNSGSAIELEAFDPYFLGRPKLDDIAVRFLPDDTTAMAAILGQNVDLLLPRRAVLGVLRTVRDRWRESREGVLTVIPGQSWVFLAPQFQNGQPADLADVRVRRALLHAIDREALAEALTGDRALAADFWLPGSDPRYQTLAGAASRIEYDPTRARDLFREAGWRRESADDVLVKQGQRFEVELTATASWEGAAALIAQSWRRAGVVVNEHVLTLSAITDRQTRASYSGVELAFGPPGLALLDSRLHSSNFPAPENQWVGGNRGRYESPELDALLERVSMTLDRGERQEVEREIARFVSAELPILGLLFYPAMAMHDSAVRNIRPPRAVPEAGRLSMGWNAHEWEKAPAPG